ncbi:probable inactive leucine-rich repeat receptor-like protein kinase At3g03770 isoform X1 [Prosopis cineraria]|uniref:probable inactive leucine-rich repeat receptor-like protein kinase At3g03770 isoform X1 n=1 Tax=Prosopis cineraria TaxID=364024 RepID=UPI0024104DB8|nr:probable inactive leucine-rich repeat receptor-like protein kinase At3g03770 isoform X1 [Prosopis cineraria]
MAMAKKLFHFRHFFLVVVFTFFLAIHRTHQLHNSQSYALLKFQKLLGYPSALRSLRTTKDFCNVESTNCLTIVCYEDNVTQLHVVGDNGVSYLPQDFTSDSLFATLGALSSLKVLSLVSMGLWGPIPESISQLPSLEILNISSNHFSGAIPIQLSLLKSLQSLVLDDNHFTGTIPMWVGSLQGLAVLSMRKNSLSGSVPTSVNDLQTLRVLDLSNNDLHGELPGLSSLKNLQVLNLENNTFGPHFPSLHTKLVSLVVRNNSFRFGIPSNLSSSYQLQKLDLSLNGFVGPFLPSLLSLPSIKYLDVSANKLTGTLFSNYSCNSDILFVNLSSNLLKGELPSCLKPENKVVALYDRNCFSNEDQDQHPPTFCQTEALAVNVMPHEQKQRRRTASKRVLVSSMGGIVGGFLVFGVVFLVIVRVNKKGSVKAPAGSKLELVKSQMNDKHDEVKTTRTALSVLENIISRVPTPNKEFVKTLARSMMEHVVSRVHHRHVRPARSIVEHVSSVNTAKLLSDARYISQTMKMGASLSAYRTFASDELKEATNNFDASCFISEGACGQIYKGLLSDGTHIAVRSLKMKKRHGPLTYMHHIELISKLRHPHLVSALGHCFECSHDDPSVSNIYIIFEFVPYRSLRGCISGSSGEKLSWAQRIAAAIGVIRGIQFLHTGMVPGLYSNNLKITDILLDNNLNVKICTYNLPLLTDNKIMVGNGTFSPVVKGNVQARTKDGEKNDVYDFGVILLEIILGRTIMFHNEVGTLKDLLQVSLATDDIARRSIVDPAVHKQCSDESLKRLMEICVRCVSENPTDRPSVEDALWNLQFAAQVQNSWGRDSIDARESPASPSLE